MSTQTEQTQKVRNKYALSSVIFGIVSIVLLQLSRGNGIVEGLGLIASLAALGTGGLGYRAAQELKKGRNWAITGIIIGAFALVVSIVLLIR